MRYYETYFEDYLTSIERFNTHPEIVPIIESMPPKIDMLENTIIYGSPGAGKYSQVLHILKKYSPSELKYDKKITIQTEKQDYTYRISDIHYEIDMSMLGCNSKLLWNEIFLQIIDIVSVKPEKTGVILCKNFHLIHTELVEIFYSYMQQCNSNFSNIKIKFFILTEQLSFIPTPIINNCHILRVKCPTKEQYLSIFHQTVRTPDPTTNEKERQVAKILGAIDSESLLNIKELRSFPHMKNVDDIPKDVFNTVCDSVIEKILNPSDIHFTGFRDTLYDILTYNLEMVECLWYILKFLIENGHLSSRDTSDILLRTYPFLKYYNNNYRPIYHLESIIFYIINKIHGYNEPGK